MAVVSDVFYRSADLADNAVGDGAIEFLFTVFNTVTLLTTFRTDNVLRAGICEMLSTNPASFTRQFRAEGSNVAVFVAGETMRLI